MKGRELSLFLLRVSLGILFLWAGWDKVTAPFSAAGYLKSATGPLASFFQSFAGNTTIDMLVAWTLTLGGAALILGVLTRLSALGLGLLMALIYLSHFPPTVPNHLVDQHIILILALFVISVFEAGKVWGLGKKVEKLGQWAL